MDTGLTRAAPRSAVESVRVMSCGKIAVAVSGLLDLESLHEHRRRPSSATVYAMVTFSDRYLRLFIADHVVLTRDGQPSMAHVRSCSA